MKRDLPTGIFTTPTGFRAYVWVPVPNLPAGRIKTKRFKADTPLDTIKRWREEQRIVARKTPEAAPIVVDEAGFAADALRYLNAVRAMPSYKDRVRQIGEWVALFGNRKRKDITPGFIRAARDRWLTVGPKKVQTRTPDGRRDWTDLAVPLSASTINQRLRALENLYTVLDGKHAYNPVREVPEVDPPDPLPKGQTFALALEILAHMPDVTTPKKGELPEAGSLSRVRFEAMLWTGLPAIQLARLTPACIDWMNRTVTVPRRQKGRSSRRAGRRRIERPRPLLPQAVDALTRFFALGANRTFSSTSLGRSVRRAIHRANKVRTAKGLPLIPVGLTVYALCRHTFGTEVYRATRNVHAVKELLGHSDLAQSERYARAAIDEGLIHAIGELGRVASRAVSPGKAKGKVSSRSAVRRVRTQRTPVRRGS